MTNHMRPPCAAPSPRRPRSPAPRPRLLHSALAPRPSSRHALTLLEVILAVLLLSLVVTAVTGAISAILGMESEGRKRLEGYEICNRIVLQFLDDKDALPSSGLPITYGDHKYFWELDQTDARMVINKKQEAGGANLQALTRYKLIGVTVYAADFDGNRDVKADPIAFLSRIVDPAAPRNPDSLTTYEGNVDKIKDLVNTAIGATGTNTSTARLQGRQLR